MKRKYNVSHEDIQFIAQTLYSGLIGGVEEPQESQGFVNVERELAFDLKQVQTASLSGQSTMHTKMFPPSKAGRTAGRTAVIAAYVACPVGLAQTMQAGIDAAIQRTFQLCGFERTYELLKRRHVSSLNESRHEENRERSNCIPKQVE